MSKQRLISREANAHPSSFCCLILAVAYVFLLSPLAIAAAQAAPTTVPQKYVPPELQVADPDVKAYLDSADKSATIGNDEESLTSLQEALELATKQKSLADKDRPLAQFPDSLILERVCTPTCKLFGENTGLGSTNVKGQARKRALIAQCPPTLQAPANAVDAGGVSAGGDVDGVESAWANKKTLCVRGNDSRCFDQALLRLLADVIRFSSS